MKANKISYKTYFRNQTLIITLFGTKIVQIKNRSPSTLLLKGYFHLQFGISEVLFVTVR